MKMGFYSTLTMMILVLMVGVTSFTEGQENPACADKLAPCLDYMNSTNPPTICCNPLIETVTNELPCLCILFTGSALLESFGTNLTQALNLTRNCGVNIGSIDCNGIAPSPAAGTQPVLERRKVDGAADRIAFTGISFLLLFWCSMMFY
ncbi:Lipid transfer protein [Quillaja saponaria]|uniref:Lipid transfer protein n=1 Tax=Quillaja saponaria TaxID=32244 RepID=A0AAD7L6G8_QUISA|nr:Lipid transfer protein [Quillaja saponaria]